MTPHLPILQSFDDKQSQDWIQMQFVFDILKLLGSSFETDQQLKKCDNSIFII